MCLHRKIFHQLQIEKNVINLAMGIVAIATTTIGIGINPTNTLEHTTRQFWQQFEISSANHTNWQHSKRANIIKLIQSAAITTTTVRNHAFECEKIFWNRIASMHTKNHTNRFWLQTTPITAYPSTISNAMRKHQLIFWHKTDLDSIYSRQKRQKNFKKKRNKKIQINYKIINKQTSQPAD